MKKNIGKGIDDFKKLITNNHYFVDKTLFIKEIVDNGSEVILLTRPRRFGKTLNMSMLKYFFSNENSEENIKLYNDLKIQHHYEIMKLQGKYPVIYITLANAKIQTYEQFLDKIREIMSGLYYEYNEIINSIDMPSGRKNAVSRILSENSTEVDLQSSLKYLSLYLEKYYNEKVIILMDEYDSAIHESYSYGFYTKVINFMRSFLNSTFKGNSSLYKGVLTGILRVSKESMFSDFNNPDINDITNGNYSTCFGFTETEVDNILSYFDLTKQKEDFKHWYNGYLFGKTTIYNPWSIISYITENKETRSFKAYWANTSSNALIKELLNNYRGKVDKELEDLIQGRTIRTLLNLNIVFEDLKKDKMILWNFLLASGYLKIIKIEQIGTKNYIDVKIPNLEVKEMYENTIITVLRDSFKSNISELIYAVITGDVIKFENIFRNLIINIMSFYDTKEDIAEQSYHSFLLGVLASLQETYIIDSNRESGYGRYDIMLNPRNKNDNGIIIELKLADDNKNLEEVCLNALKQIKDKEYYQTLNNQGVNHILKYGIAFRGKEVKILYSEN